MMEVRRVAGSEYDLLTLARAIVGETPAEIAEPILRGRRKAPQKLGPTSMEVLKDTLATGVVLALARRGGWRTERFLSGAKPFAGRMWERHPAPKLTFTKATVELLRWMTFTPFGLPDVPTLDSAALSIGDEVVFYLAADLLVRVGCGSAIAPAAAFSRSPLCWLAFPEVVRGTRAAANPPEAIRFAPLTAAEGAVVVEALQPDLMQRWATAERRKREIRDPERMTDLATLQESLMDSWLSACDAAKRRDLALFLVDATAAVLRGGMNAHAYVESLDRTGPLSQRTAARRAAGQMLRSMARWKKWNESHTETRFFDDGYDASQMMLSRWEVLGDDGWEKVQGILRDLDALDLSAPPTAEEKKA